MKSFTFIEAGSFAEAAAASVDKKYSLPVLKAGGLDVLDHLKEGLWSPDVLVNVKRARSEDGPSVKVGDGVIRIEANATLAEIAAATASVSQGLSKACESAATPQLRNMASAAGNLLQRPRCWYYRNEQFACLKKGGKMCYAVDGENAYHAIFGPGPCHIVHPSNLAPALMVLDGEVHLVGGKRATVKVADLYHMPDRGILTEHNLEVGEVITHITCKVGEKTGFYVVKAKQSFDWPLVFACVNLKVEGGKIAKARVVAGAVAPVPWGLPAVEEALAGCGVDDEASVTKACMLAGAKATPMRDNAYKVQLLNVCVKRAVMKALGKPVPEFTSEA